MKVALIGDIHANLPALERVLAAIREHGVRSIWNVGDSVGGGPFPEEVVQRLRQGDVLSTLSRQDRKILRFKKRQDKWRRRKSLQVYLAYQWAYEHLSKKSRKYLRFLSREMRMEVQGKRILLTHARPGSGKAGISPDTAEEDLQRLAREANADVIVCGHSHQPFTRQVGEVWFISPGSVGQFEGGAAQACYALLEVRAGSVQVAHHRVAYDPEPLVAAMRERGFPELLAQRLFPGGLPAAPADSQDAPQAGSRVEV